jgi:hypothetical protein
MAKNALKWTLPKGWTRTAGSGMRFATLTPSGPGKAEVSVVMLPGAAGTELANVNRWRGQIALQPLDLRALGTARQTVQCKAGTVAVYDFTGEGYRRIMGRRGTGCVLTLTVVVILAGAAGMLPFENSSPDREGIHNYPNALRRIRNQRSPTRLPFSNSQAR